MHQLCGAPGKVCTRESAPSLGTTGLAFILFSLFQLNMKVFQSVCFLAFYVICLALVFLTEIYKYCFVVPNAHFAAKGKVKFRFISILICMLLFYGGRGILFLLMEGISIFDFSCLCVHLILTMMQMGAWLAVPLKIINPSILYIIMDWSLIPFFAWMSVWTRFARRGW